MVTCEAADDGLDAYYERRKAEGWSQLTVWLPPSAVARLDALRRTYDWSADEVLTRLLDSNELSVSKTAPVVTLVAIQKTSDAS